MKEEVFSCVSWREVRRGHCVGGGVCASDGGGSATVNGKEEKY